MKPDADVAEAIPFQPVEFDLDVDESGPTPVQDKLLREIASKLPGPQSSAVLQALASQDGGNPIIVAWDSSKVGLYWRFILNLTNCTGFGWVRQVSYSEYA